MARAHSRGIAGGAAQADRVALVRRVGAQGSAAAGSPRRGSARVVLIPVNDRSRQRHLKPFVDSLQPIPTLKGELGAEDALRGVFKLLDHRVSEGEIGDVRQALPAEVRALWPAP